MSGLILAGIGKGIADAGNTVGSFMLKSNEADERARERAELQRERLAAAADQKERDRLLRLEIAGARGESGNKGGGGGFKPEDLGEGGQVEGVIARELGVNIPTLRALRKSSETGDYSSLIPFGANSQTEADEVTQAGYPPGFEKEVRAKTQALARIEQRFLFGKDYKSVVDAQQGEVALDAGRGAITDPSQAGRLGQGVAVMGGKDLVGGDSNVTRNKFTGQTSVTPVGQSQIRENDAQASKARADAAAAPDKGSSKIEDQITRAEQALSLVRARIEKGYREPTTQEKYNPELLSKYQADRNRYVEQHPDVKRQSERLERLYTGGATQQSGAKPAAGAKPSAPTTTAPAPKRGAWNPQTRTIEWK
jgi:hypothetical protein